MPSGQSRNPHKNFRRKSSANLLDTDQQSSFRVLERPEKSNARDWSSSFTHNQSKSVDNLSTTLNRYGGDTAAPRHILRAHRGSGGTTSSLSSAVYDVSDSSVRYSSSTTIPSSLDAEQEQDQSPIEKHKTRPPLSGSTSAIETSTSFAARAGKALSFGRKSSKPPASTQYSIPAIPTIPAREQPQIRPKSEASMRDRSFTTSSYASTAKPPRLDTHISPANFGEQEDGFGNMFDGITNRESIAPSPGPSPLSHAEPTKSPLIGRTMSPPSHASPTLLQRPFIDDRRQSINSQKSNEQLISGRSSELGSPNIEMFPNAPKAAALSNFSSHRGYFAVPDRYHSPELSEPRGSPTISSGFVSAQSSRHANDSSDNLRGLTAAAPRERSAWPDGTPADTESPKHTGPVYEVPGNSGYNTRKLSTPDAIVPPQTRDYKPEPSARHNLRPSTSLADVANTASLYIGSPTLPEEPIAVGKQRAMPQTLSTPKKMTKAQFEQASRLRDVPTNDTEDSASDVSEDEDEGDKQKKIAAERRRQEATMSVYRQKMKKVTGGGGKLSELPSQSSRNPLEKSSSSYSLSGLGPPGPSSSRSVSPADLAADNEDDNVPLGSLQAHGFPNKVRPPSQMPGSQPPFVENASGGLPAFARKLPVDPYYGAGLVNNAHRESLGFGSSAASMYGGAVPTQPPYAQPGGLVGVIASEERSRASRRGSPNPLTGGYGPIPLPSNMHGSPAPPFGRSSSMLSLNPPQAASGMFGAQAGAFGGVSPADMSSMNTQQQMAHLMQMQTQMMQQMMALQAGQTPQVAMANSQMAYPFPAMGSSPGTNALGIHSAHLQAPSTVDQHRMSTLSAGRPGSLAQSRSMSMLQAPTNWTGDLGQQRSKTMGSIAASQYAGSVHGLDVSGYTPSIAPSERSNVGMPSRYRPVSVMESGDTFNSTPRSKTMSSATLNTLSFGAGAPSPLGQTSGNASKPKSTIRLVDRPKSSSRTNLLRSGGAEDEEDEAGWAELAAKKERMQQKRAAKHDAGGGTSLADLYQGLDQHITA